MSRLADDAEQAHRPVAVQLRAQLVLAGGGLEGVKGGSWRVGLGLDTGNHLPIEHHTEVAAVRLLEIVHLELGIAGVLDRAELREGVARASHQRGTEQPQWRPA